MDNVQALQLILYCLLFALLIISAYTDLAQGKVYNWCTLPAVVFGLFGNLLLGLAVENLWWNQYIISSLMGLGIGGGVFLFLYWIGGFGAGDVKLMAGVGAIMGLQFTIWTMVYSSFVGAIMAMGKLIWHGKFVEGVRDSFRLMFTIDKAKYAREKKEEEDGAQLTIPFGFAISVGGLWTFFFFILKTM